MPVQYQLLTLRHWFVVTLFALLPACRAVFFAARKLRARRINAGFCADCGYNLRATPERCPECGRKATNPAPASAANLLDYATPPARRARFPWLAAAILILLIIAAAVISFFLRLIDS